VLVQTNDDGIEGHAAQKVRESHREHAQLKKMKLGEQPECAADVKKLCSELTNNFAIIDCLQSDNLACTIELFASVSTFIVCSLSSLVRCSMLVSAVI